MESNSNTPPIKSFTSRKPPITFDIDGEQFVAYQVLPAETFGRFAEKVLMLQRAGSDYEGPDKLDLTLSETVTVLLDAVELGLAADSAQRVAARLSDLDNPIDVATLSEVLMLQRAGSDYEGPDKLDLTLSETVTVLLDAVELGLAADSAQRVATRLSDLDNPIDVSTLSEVLLWLLEQYGMSGKDADSAVDSDRPTPPTSD